MADLSGRTAFVTGGSRGLGLAIAGGLLERGADVAIMARDEAAVRAAAERLQESTSSRRVLAVVGDVGDDDSVAAAVEAVRSWSDHLDILVNNAGPQLAPTPLTSVDLTTLRSALDTKLIGYLRVAQAVLPSIGENGTGSVINVVGATAHALIPNAGVTGIVNAATAALTSYLATDVAARNIRVNAISPGMTKTEGWLHRHVAAAEQQGVSSDDVRAAAVASLGIRLGRWAELAEVASVVAFLASDDASYITGQVIRADGGLTKPVV